ncbi:DUF2125 domain-containing protein [Shimia sp.]|uniref:DUF2125 domain-containing protein n=1 Tax=Shimia sp. TaxID=1954381 RepID=UPI00329A5AEE
MNFGKRVAGSSLLASFLLSTTALADVGPRDVWESWRGYLSGFGYDVSAQEKTDGNTLNVNDLTLGMQIPDEDGTVSIDMGDIQFVDNGDGTVDVVMPSQMPMHVVVDADGENVDATVTLTHKDMTTVVSGTPEDMTYDYNASELTFDLTKLVVDGEELPGLVVNAIMQGVLGQSKMLTGDTMETQQQMSVDSIAYVVQAADPDGGGEVDLKGNMTGLKADAQMVLPLGDYTEDPAALFQAGFDIAGSYAIQGSDVDLSFEEDGAPGKAKVTTGAGDMAFEMNETVMAYGGAVSDIQINATGPDIPLPIDVSFGELGYGFEMPMKASQDQQDFSLGLVLGDLAVSEMIWSMFDPGQVLPHDPATLVIDLAGKATILKDIITLDEDSDEVPGELNALTLNDLQVHIAGASLTGMGDFVFDNSDMVSFDGFPRPEGALDLNIVGINGLMDKLVSMGLLPEEQVMGARMMLSMFSIPGEGDDELNSTIVVNEQGHVLANGQRLK